MTEIITDWNTMGASKTCPECKRTLPIEAFGLIPSRRCNARCRPCNIKVAGEWYRANKESKRAYDAKRRDEKRDLYRAASKRWREAHPHAKNADTNSRRRRVRERMPSWISPAQLRAFYEQAQRVTACLGIQHHVDHVVPLRGRKVSGLHVPENLAVIPQAMNSRKLNHYSLTHGGRK